MSCVSDIVCDLFSETFAIFLGVVVECNGCLVIPVCSFHRFRFCLCMSEVYSSFRRLRAVSQLFALLKLFLCVILHTMWSGKSLQLLCILPFDILCLCVISGED